MLLDSEQFFKYLHKISKEKNLPEENELLEILEKVVQVLEKENASYRPIDKSGNPDAVLDFASFARMPVIAVPDLHGRSDFLMKLLEYRICNRQVYDLLESEEIMVVCLGDGVHGELRAKERWRAALKKYQEGVAVSPEMEEEVCEDFATMRTVWELKVRFPLHFHFLKGNHENVLNSDENGDRVFFKYAKEGEMVRDFIETRYSQGLLYAIHSFEKKLPLCACFGNWAMSHAEPASVYTRKQIVNGYSDSQLVYDFTWTSNEDEAKNTVLGNLKTLTDKFNIKKNWFWIGGHRPVWNEKFNARQEGKFIQIHNTKEMNIAFVYGCDFDPAKHVINIEGGC